MSVASATILNCPPERAWQVVETSRLFTFITAPLARFLPVDPPVLPAVLDEGRYLVRMWLFSVVPFGTRWIFITNVRVETTPSIWAHASLFYGYPRHRWRQFVARNLEDLD